MKIFARRQVSLRQIFSDGAKMFFFATAPAQTIHCSKPDRKSLQMKCLELVKHGFCVLGLGKPEAG